MRVHPDRLQHPTDSANVRATNERSLAADRMAFRPVDFFEQPVPLARDVFRAGRIGRVAMERCVRVLRDYRLSLRELGIADGKPNRIVCTNILAEATNQDIFLNRIHVACGLEVEPLDDGEQTRLVYIPYYQRGEKE